MSTLQCLVLAQLYCIQRGDYSKLLTYKALAISLSSRLGLQQSQKRFALGTLTCETRKKVFWTLYTLDRFVLIFFNLTNYSLTFVQLLCRSPWLAQATQG